MKVVALLESMWGDRPKLLGQAPRFFRINPNNNSGRRLYKLVGPDTNLYVTNCCRELQSHANGHGSPDFKWVRENLEKLKPDVLLVCGTVSRKTFAASGYVPKCAIFMDHPAARRWTKKKMVNTAKEIQCALKSCSRSSKHATTSTWPD